MKRPLLQPLWLPAILVALAWIVATSARIIAASGAAAPQTPILFPDWYYESEQAAARLGEGARAAGDVNGDGYDDVIVGAPKYSLDVYKAGAIFLFYGSAGGLSNRPDWSFGGGQTGEELGSDVAAAGDINGDGYADIIAGAPRYSSDGPRTGRVYLFYGSPAGPSQTPDRIIDGTVADSYLGWAVSTAGDVNGDQFDDITIGARWYSDEWTNEGMVLLYLGAAGGLMETPAWSRKGGQAGAALGTAVATAGDVNGDGYDDVLIGAPRYDDLLADAGRAYLFLGSAGGLASQPDWQVTGGQADARLGAAVNGAGDVNGDGYSDAIVGAPGLDGDVTGAGGALLYFGYAGGLFTQYGWTAVSDQSYSQFGQAVNTAGDLNRDGYDDVVVGAYRYSYDQAAEGRIFVYYGAVTGPAALPDWVAEGNKAETEFGYAAGGEGDINGDGWADLIVGAPNYRSGTDLCGRAYLFLGRDQIPFHNLFLPILSR